MLNVYVVPKNNMTYSVCMSETAPYEHAMFLVRENTYPTELCYERHDINGSRVIEATTLDCCDDLIAILNWLGEARNAILKIWDFDVQQSNQEIVELFAVCRDEKLRMNFEYAAALGYNPDWDMEDFDAGSYSTIDVGDDERLPF